MFFTSLPVIFTYTHLLNPVELTVFLLLIAILVYFSTPQPYLQFHEAPSKSPYFLLKHIWLGQTHLWRAFWPFFVLVNGIFFYIDYRATNISFTIASWTAIHGMLFLPLVWWLTSVWRCSPNTQLKIWGVCARTLTLYVILDFLLRLVIRYEFPNLLFDCRLLVIEFGDCL
ncbi:MAG: hypothetical protein WC782_00335 [Methylococcaceae bacterium]|jgi:hypothetical protein